MPESLFSPDQHGPIQNLIRQADQYRHAAVFSQAVVEIARHLNRNPMADIEQFLRQTGSTTYLISRKISQMPDFESTLPIDPVVLYPYFLWVEVNGADEAEKILQLENLTSENNTLLLPQTGLLVVKDHTPLAFDLNAKNN